MKNKGFTLIELIIVIVIIAILSAVILFSITQYINKGKDSNISANLAVLIPAGEVYYNSYNSTYKDFCDVGNSVIKNVISQMPVNSNGSCYNSTMPSSGNISDGNPYGVCCSVAGSSQNYQAWAACARELADPTKAWCVDSSGFKEEICRNNCKNNFLPECPDPAQQTGCT